MTCGYCGSNTHERGICPHEALAKIKPEYDRLVNLCKKENDAFRHGGSFKA